MSKTFIQALSTILIVIIIIIEFGIFLQNELKSHIYNDGLSIDSFDVNIPYKMSFRWNFVSSEMYFLILDFQQTLNKRLVLLVIFCETHLYGQRFHIIDLYHFRMNIFAVKRIIRKKELALNMRLLFIQKYARIDFLIL